MNWSAPPFRIEMVAGVIMSEANVGAVTVKLAPLLGTPSRVTTTFPLVAPMGTEAVMLVELQPEVVAPTPLKVTALPPCDAPKPAPVIVTDVVTGPDVGDRLEITGGGRTVKFRPLLFVLATETTRFPVVAPDGTVTEMLEAPQLDTGATVPLKLTVLLPCVAPKPVPVSVTGAPTGPELELKPVTTSGTVKFTALLVKLEPFVTVTFPVEAPAGTHALMLVSLQLLMVAEIPLKTTPCPCVPPNCDPVIVTRVPGAPEAGDNLSIYGDDVVTMNGSELLDSSDVVTVTSSKPSGAEEGTCAVMAVSAQLTIVAVSVPKVTVLVP